MNTWSRPAERELDAVETLAIRPENRRYFFDRLENPNWVTPLAQRGHFGEPPGPTPSDEAGHVRYPPWPEGRYLARMAPAAPDAVAEVLSGLPPSSNPAVMRAAFNALEGLPDEHLGRLAERVVEWVAAPGVGYFDDSAASAVARLLRCAFVEEGLSAAGALLALRAAGDYSPSNHAEPVGWRLPWTYESAIASILPDLVNAAGAQGLMLLSSLLDDSIRLSRGPGGSSEDGIYAFTWRPAIEDHPQNTDGGIRDIVVSAVRDAAVMLAAAGEDELRQTVRHLEAGSTLHRRIALHVLATATGDTEMVTERVADRRLFEDRAVVHEYAALLRQRFGDADTEARQSFLAWVIAGPEVERVRQRWTDFAGSPPSDEDIESYVGRWQRDLLSFVTDWLQGDESVMYRGLIQRFGEPEHTDFLSWVTTDSSGPQSPLSEDDMSAWHLSQIVEYLQRWRPDDSSAMGFSPSIEGLGRVFEAVVADRAAEVSASADLLVGLDPTYVRSFMDGIRSAVKDGASVSWEPLLRLMSSAVEHPFEPDREVTVWDRDPGWRWARGAAASLIETGVTDRDNRIPFEHRSAVWQILERLATDPDPSEATEASRMDGNARFFNLSINSNRGTAMHAVIEYALWCCRELEASGHDTAAGFELLPEARALLEAHLQPEHDPSLAIRSVYGRWLSWLALVDERWVVANIHRIFPREPELSAFQDAAWDTYIRWCPPYDPVFRAIRTEYEAAVERVPSRQKSDAGNDDRPDQHLGQHLVVLWWRSTAPRSLLDRWFEFADDELAAGVMSYVGSALNDAKGDIDPDILARVRELWDARIEQISAQPDAHTMECQAFAATFASGRLADDWSLDRLETTLRLNRPGRRSWDVVERLAELSASRPAIATRLALKMLKDAPNDWDHDVWSEPIQSLLQTTSDAHDQEASENRSAIIDHYVTRGDIEYRRFIAPLPI